MKKRMLAAILAAIMSAAALASCGSGESSSTAGSTAGGSTASADNGADSSEPGEIPTLIWWGIGDTPDDLEMGLEEMNKYAGEEIGVNIDLRLIGWGEWEQKTNTIVNSGEYFDMMFLTYKNYSTFVDLGAIADITELVPAEAPELWEFIPEDVWQGAMIQHKLYSVPTYKDSSATQYWFFDDQYVQKYNIDVPSLEKKDLIELDGIFREMKAGEGENFYPLQLAQGIQLPFASPDVYYDDMAAGMPFLGAVMENGSPKVISVLEQPDTMDHLKVYHSWYQDGIINPDAPTMTEVPKMRPFLISQAFPGAEVQMQVTEGVEKYDMVQASETRFSTNSIQGSLNAISVDSEYKAEALKFLQFANLDHKMRDMLAYGVEGTHFEYVSDNVVHKLTDTWTLPSYSQATFFTLSTLDDGIADQWEQVAKLNENAVSSEFLGFVLDISQISTEVANCKAAYDKYRYELQCGASDPEEMIPVIMEDLRANGLDTIIAEAQKQLDEFCAK